jgi:hypothetical protein
MEINKIWQELKNLKVFYSDINNIFDATKLIIYNYQSKLVVVYKNSTSVLYGILSNKETLLIQNLKEDYSFEFNLKDLKIRDTAKKNLIDLIIDDISYRLEFIDKETKQNDSFTINYEPIEDNEKELLEKINIIINDAELKTFNIDDSNFDESYFVFKDEESNKKIANIPLTEVLSRDNVTKETISVKKRNDTLYTIVFNTTYVNNTNLYKIFYTVAE